METRFEKEVRFLKIYAVISTLMITVFFLTAFAAGNKKFEEIDVERINIVERDGKLRMVISNKERQHPGIVNGKTIEREGGKRGTPGLLFFNEKGDEAGGMVISDSGGNTQYVSLTFDKFRQDQTIGLQHLESDNGAYFAGLKIWDRPDTTYEEVKPKLNAVRKITDEAARKAAGKELMESGALGNERIVVGRGRNKAAYILLSDAKGRTRIEISVDAAGNPKLNFLDENGKVTYTLPESGKTVKN
jgi:hypothetical protein